MMVADLRKLVIEQQNSRFCNAHPTPEERENLPHNKAGYWKMEKDENGDWFLSEFWLDTAVFDREVLKGRDKKAFFPLLIENGYVKKEDKNGYGCVRRPEKEKTRRFIVVLASAFSGEKKDTEFSVEKPKKNGVLHDGEFYPVKDCAK